MRRGGKDKLNSSQRNSADRFFDFVKDKSSNLVSTVQEHVTALADTTGTLAKQKLFQTLLSSGVMKSEEIRRALQIGIEYFLNQQALPGGIFIHRQKFPAVGGVTPSHTQNDFDIEAFGLETFFHLMAIYGIDRHLLKNQICSGELKEIINPSSSGSLLYLSSDSSFLVKTIRDYDVKFIQQKFLKEYFRHIREGPDSYLAKFFGVYGYIPYLSQQRSITVDPFALRFAIFANFIPRQIEIHEKYDLKGSSYRRDADLAERLKNSTTFKDNDFRHFHPNGFGICRQIYERLKQILTRDVDFLESLNIMDYSLLLTIHNIDNPVQVKRTDGLEALVGTVHDALLLSMSQQRPQSTQKLVSSRPVLQRLETPTTSQFYARSINTCDMNIANQYGAVPATNEHGERVLLFIGIIDIFQTFDICKVMQRQYQTVENRDVVAERSIVEADFYARRFKEFMFESVFRPIDDPVRLTSTSSSLYPSLNSFH